MLDYLKDLSDWQTLGAHILPGHPAGQIEIIYANHKGNVRECKKELFIEYLKTGDRSWKTIIAALIKMKHTNLADDIKQKVGL